MSKKAIYVLPVNCSIESSIMLSDFHARLLIIWYGIIFILQRTFHFSKQSFQIFCLCNFHRYFSIIIRNNCLPVDFCVMENADNQRFPTIEYSACYTRQAGKFMLKLNSEFCTFINSSANLGLSLKVLKQHDTVLNCLKL